MVEDRADARLSRRAGGLEAAEVVRAQQAGGGPLHGVGIEPPVDEMPAVAAAKDVADRAVVDHVAVALPQARRGWDESRRALPRPREHGHVCGATRRSGPAAAPRPASGLSVRNEATWPRAWTPASVRPLAKSRAGRPVIFSMVASSVAWTVRHARLRLPAGVVRAVIGQGQLDAAHGEDSSPGSASPATRRSARRWWPRPCGGCR